MRYRIRIITLALVCALLFSALFIVRSVFLPSGMIAEHPEVTPEPSSSVLPESTSTPSGQWPPLLIEDVTSVPESFFDTSGL